ncbi:MAG: hypothetical protein J7480_00315 [Microbacteriaceae bacterium]|nr:hypothetical protein [Microbacteriaceae bacterium]
MDVGASGSRLALAPIEDRAGSAEVRQLAGERLAVGPGGSTAAQVALDLVTAALDAWPDIDPASIRGAAAGVAGLETVVTDPASYPARLRELLPTATVAFAGDMVTAHLGALGEGGAVLAAGTGSIVLGTDLDTVWHRVDGWGHLIGDLGSGAWIGTRALQLAAAAGDGRGLAGAALHAALVSRIGPLPSWPATIYHRADRAGALAELAPLVQDCARSGDAGAARILDEAARHLADSLLAALVHGVPRVAALVGGLVTGESMLGPLVRREVARRRPDVELRAPLGTPLDGAVRLAALAAAGRLPTEGPLVR